MPMKIGAKRAGAARLGALGLAAALLLALFSAVRAAPAAITAPPPDWSAYGAASWAGFGHSVGNAGDVNGDGFDDLIVGAPQTDQGQPRAGAAFAYYGSADGLSAMADWSADGAGYWSLLGLVATTAGDVNNDGFDDALIAGQGVFAVFHGSAAGLSATADWQVQHSLTQSFVSQVAATAGDVNGDGFDDVIIGRRGAAELYLGSAAGLGATPTSTLLDPQSGSRFGMAVSGAGDVNNDGYDDILVGAPYFGQGQLYEGVVFLYYGGPGGPDADPAWFYDSDVAQSFLGAPLAALGDTNGDGFDDFAVSAILAAPNGADSGRLYIFMGSAEGPGASADQIIAGDREGAYLGYAIGGADVDGDGLGDLLLGSHTYRDGMVALFPGRANGFPAMPQWTARTPNIGGTYGAAVGAGDFDGDGQLDFVTGAPTDGTGQPFAGGVFVYNAVGGATAAPAVAPPLARDATPWLPVPLRHAPPLATTGVLTASATFTDVSSLVNVDNVTNDTFGPLWLDLEGDGWLDLYFGNHGSAPTVYANLAGTQFFNATNQLGVITTETRYVGELDRHGAACADFDNDGDIDLFITRGANRARLYGVKTDELLINDGAALVMADAHITNAMNSWGRGRTPTWVDYDNDGWLDLYIANGDSPDIFYRNLGDGTFADVTAQTGLDPMWTHTVPQWVDYDGDGWIDLLHVSPLQLWRNQGDGTFVDVTAQTGLGSSQTIRSTAWGDIDDDGDPDLLRLGLATVSLWRNRGDGSFTRLWQVDQGANAAEFGDTDNDGDLDAVLTDGASVVHLENRNGILARPDVITEIGGGSRADVALGDYNNDGYLDIAVAGDRHALWQNDGGDNQWLKLSFEGTVSNRQGFGVEVVATLPGGESVRRVYRGTGGHYSAVGCGPLHLGLGSADTVTLDITWPSGRQQTVSAVAAGQHLTIVEPLLDANRSSR